MNYFLFLIRHILDIPVTIYYNILLFPLQQAIRFPVLFSHRICIKGVRRGSFAIETRNLKPFMIKIGVEGVEGVSGNRKGYIIMGESGRIVFCGRASLSKGVLIRAIRGTIIFGNNFYSNCNMSIVCSEKIIFGDDTLLGWDINIRDNDGHKVYTDGIQSKSVKPVHIGNHVWIGAHVDILKGVTIPDGCIIAYRSCVLHSFNEENILLGGYPARQIKSGVRWEV